jgi:uncharacterized membrane protein YvbJ
MSLFPCPECGKNISNRAQHCPHCGYPVREYMQHLADERRERQVRLAEKQKFMRKWRNRAIVASLVIVFIFVLILLLPLLHT